ncbi:unnamed protein product, partial [Dicrocoelium dendriticum]
MRGFPLRRAFPCKSLKRLLPDTSSLHLTYVTTPCPNSLFHWLPKELEPHFLSYKKQLLEEYDRLTNSISSSIENSEIKHIVPRWEVLRPIAEIFEELDVLLQADADIQQLIADVTGAEEPDEEESQLCELARVERERGMAHRQSLEQKLLQLIAPIDSSFYLPGARLELISGAGGLEAGLFARELLDMYRNLAFNRGWQFTVVHETNMTGEESCGPNHEAPLAVARVEIVGEPSSAAIQDCRSLGAYGQLRWEAGVHRVQRIPVTSKHHKIHTSTVAVSVLPLDDEVSIDFHDDDLKWEFFRSSGPGGQHVNRTDSAVRLTHLPTGTVVGCQQERFQHINKRLALEMLKEKLLSKRVKSRVETENILRRSQIGHLDRSEKIRTYNFPQDRITDHRLSRTWSGIHWFMRQTTGLSEAIQAFLDVHQAERLRNILLNYEPSKQS